MNTIKKMILGLGVLLVMFLIFNKLTTSSVPLVNAQCALPTQVTGVVVTYPYCDNGTCSYTQGKCSWDTLSGATGYNVIVTNIGTSAQVLNLPAYTSTSSAFPVATSATFRCDVTAINTCGVGAVVGTGSLLCNTELVPTTTTTTISVTTTRAASPITTLPPTGSNTIALIGFAGLVMIIISFSLLLL